MLNNFSLQYNNNKKSGYIDVSDGQKIHWETIGNKEGIPIVFLHGGPGARILPAHHNFFNLDDYNTVLFDQRGCGKSKPFAGIKNNTIQNLIEDMEELRQFLGIQKWALFGGSWGSTLALYYSIKFPNRCLGLILRGVFLGTKQEIDWFLCDMGRFYPEAYNHFLKGLNFSEKDTPSSEDIIDRASKLIFNDDHQLSQNAANVWSSYEMSCSTIEYKHREMVGETAFSMAKIELHYFMNNCFLDTNEILNNIKKLNNIPVFIIQGRHDIICPPHSAYKLNNELPSSKLTIVENAGHSAFESGINNALINSLDEMKKKINSY